MRGPQLDGEKKCPKGHAEGAFPHEREMALALIHKKQLLPAMPFPRV
jgi:hypothetical protein